METTGKLKLKMPSDNDLVTPEDFNVNSSVLEAYVTSLTQVCSAVSPTALALGKSHKTISFGSIVKSGYVFAISGGGIKVSEDGFALVDIHILLYSMAPGDVCTSDICRNGQTFYQCTLNMAEDGVGVAIDQTSKLIPVAKNDIFTVKVRNDTDVRGSLNQDASYMNVRFYKNLSF